MQEHKRLRIDLPLLVGQENTKCTGRQFMRDAKDSGFRQVREPWQIHQWGWVGGLGSIDGTDNPRRKIQCDFKRGIEKVVQREPKWKVHT